MDYATDTRDKKDARAADHPGETGRCRACGRLVVSREFLGNWLWSHSALPMIVRKPEPELEEARRR